MEILFIFFIGCAIGSFLNVLVDRLPHDESVIKGRSYCDSCKKQLAWHDLIPVVSFILLRGKCRCCHSPISWQYPLVELLTGILFVMVILHPNNQIFNFQFSIFNLVYYFFIVSSLIVIFFTDLKYGIIPDKIVYPAIIVTFFYLIINYQLSTINYLISALGAFLLFFLLHFITRGRGMGFGDVKLAGLLGLFLGFPKIVVSLYLAFLTGAVVSLILVMLGKKKLKGSTVPFGPFLVVGTLVSMFYGERLVNVFITFF
ncbi:MAG: prepilin peptidase [Candidatus Levybacteria bacterium]|nr:prepilin peptidase [Candidatus Levybacteria bacterium]